MFIIEKEYTRLPMAKYCTQNQPKKKPADMRPPGNTTGSAPPTEARDSTPEKNWVINQNPRKITAGSSVNQGIIKMGINVTTLARGIKQKIRSHHGRNGSTGAYGRNLTLRSHNHLQDTRYYAA